VVGVVEPGAQAGVAVSSRQRHLVLATEATVSHGAYTRAIHALEPRAVVEELACSLFVALAEEGWTEGAAASATAKTYLGRIPERREADQPDTVILGCTHFPLLADVIRETLGSSPAIVDSATATANLVRELLAREGLARGGVEGSAREALAPGGRAPDARAPAAATSARLELLVTDGAARFARLGPRFLGESFAASDVELVDL
jgi:glutamate racemase